jgi:hypothetical protein
MNGSVVTLPIHESLVDSNVAAPGDVSCVVRTLAWVLAMTVPSRGAVVAM